MKYVNREHELGDNDITNVKLCYKLCQHVILHAIGPDMTKYVNIG